MNPANISENYRKIISIEYVNYKGERNVRFVIPKGLRFGANEWHTTPQWLLLAFDLKKEEDREFALKDVMNIVSHVDEIEQLQPMSTAPKDGVTVVELWLVTDKGEVEERQGPMVWNIFANNPLVQTEKGIWAAHNSKGALMYTWSDKGEGAPTHWRPFALKGKV